MYAQDSFFSLTPWGQVGLAVLSAVLFAVVLSAGYFGLRRHKRGVRLIGAITIFWLFLWLSPQVYYQYYSILIPTLPAQWVIKAPFGPGYVTDLMLFRGRETLAAHSQGVLGWCLLLVCGTFGSTARARL